MSLSTIATPAKAGTRSLRATLPEGVVAYLDLKAGDKLEWRMEIENGDKVVKLRKAQKGR
jgi:hypothetical protein